MKPATNFLHDITTKRPYANIISTGRQQWNEISRHMVKLKTVLSRNNDTFIFVKHTQLLILNNNKVIESYGII